VSIHLASHIRMEKRVIVEATKGAPLYFEKDPVWISSDSPSPMVHFSAKVQASNDAHIFLLTSRTEVSGKRPITKGYEIVLGGWGNTRSEIRKSKVKSLATLIHRNPLLSNVNDTAIDLTVVFSATGGLEIEVALKNSGEVIFGFDKKATDPIKEVYVSSGYGSDSKWVILPENAVNDAPMTAENVKRPRHSLLSVADDDDKLNVFSVNLKRQKLV
jgi:Farnesoic acid 0-methyl transferase